MSTDKQKILNNLRECIPGFECVPGCTQCCSHVPWSFYEAGLLSKEKRMKLNHFSLKCSFSTDLGCSVYADRPITCRIFAVCEGMICPRGAPADETLDRQTVELIVQQYNETFFRGEKP